MLVDICRVPMPVFWGQGGGEKSLGVWSLLGDKGGVTVSHKQVIDEVWVLVDIFFGRL